MSNLLLNETLTVSDPLWWVNWLFAMSLLFFIGGIAGWVIELFFRRYVSQKHWVNPGFLVGPLLPLYGFGVVVLFLFCAMPWENWIANVVLRDIVVILAMAVAMTLVEYIAGLIFIKGLGIKLWDYSKRWGNIQGIICPVFSLAWGVIGAGYFFFLYPPLLKFVDFALSYIYPWLFALGMMVGILVVDLGYSFHVVAKIKAVIADRKLVVDWDRIKMSFQDYHKKLQEHAPWLFAFSAETEQFKKMLGEYKKNLIVAKNELQARLAAKKEAKQNKKNKTKE